MNRQYYKMYHKPSVCPSFWPTNSIQENTCSKTDLQGYSLKYYLYEKNINNPSAQQRTQKGICDILSENHRLPNKIYSLGPIILKNTHTLTHTIYKLTGKIQSKMLTDSLWVQRLSMIFIFFLLSSIFANEQFLGIKKESSYLKIKGIS